jgi:thiol-disulfide isomerase/thioredoxin
MKKPFFLLTFLLFYAHFTSAQITLRGKLADAPPDGIRQMALEAWNTDRWQQMDILNLNPDNTFSTHLTAAAPGQYRLRLWNQAKMWNDFIVADSAMADTALVFDLHFNSMDAHPAKISGSPANALYFKLMNAELQRRDTTITVTSAQADSAQAAQNRLCLSLAKQHRNTLIGDIALLLYEPQISDYPNNAAVKALSVNAFAKAHALDKIPFHHQNILFHNAYIKSLNRYFYYFDRDGAGNKAYIDGVMGRRNGNDAVDVFLFKYLLDKMMDYKQEEGVTYLLNWYAPDCATENPLPNNTQNLIEALKACEPGKVVPNLVMNDLEGHPMSLGTTCAANKLTLMLFWRSTCSHCKAFEPELEQLYEKYHPLGLEVYALSADKSIEEWHEDLQKHATPWVNVFIPKDRRSEISRAFPTPSTPTLIALDKDRRVVTRLLSRGNLDRYLSERLSVKNKE